MKTICIEINGAEYRARIMPHDDSWQDAAMRAIKGRFGRSTCYNGWAIDCWQEDRQGNRTRALWRTTVLAKPDRQGNYPILGEARVWIDREETP